MTSVEDQVRLGAAAGIVDRQIYTDPAILELEREQIFRRTWQYICMTRDLAAPGDYYTALIAGEPVIVVKGNDGELRAFYNACTHRGAVLTGDRRGNCGQILKCMYHAWAFNLQGSLVGVPYEEGYPDSFSRDEYGLVPVHCDTFLDLVFVALDPAVPSLEQYLGDMTEHLADYLDGIEPIGRNSWIYKGNWKLWHENFRDNYHPEWTHRVIHDTHPHYADSGGNWGVDHGHSVLQWTGPRPPQVQVYARSLARHSGVHIDVEDLKPRHQDDRPEGTPGEVLAVFPNLDIQPGPKQGGRGMRRGYIQTVTPLGIDRARVEITVYSSSDDTAEERRDALASLATSQGSWGTISCDDTEAAYRCQLGLLGQGTRSNLFTRGAAPGRGGSDAQSRDEYSQREFYRAYYDYLDGQVLQR